MGRLFGREAEAIGGETLEPELSESIAQLLSDLEGIALFKPAFLG